MTTESEPWVPIDKFIKMGMGKVRRKTYNIVFFKRKIFLTVKWRDGKGGGVSVAC